MKTSKIRYIRRVLASLEPLQKIPPKHRPAIAPILTDDCLHKICEGCQNLLRNTFDLDKNEMGKVRRKLKKHKKDIRIFSKPETSLARKRKILANPQTGGGKPTNPQIQDQKQKTRNQNRGQHGV